MSECSVSDIMDAILTNETEMDDEAQIVSISPRGVIAFCESPYPECVEIATLDAIERKGGQKILSLACKAADSLGLSMSVLAHPLSTKWRTATSLDELEDFYRRHGFEADTARDEPWNFMSLHMIRRYKKG